ncbi:TerD family protein [Streptomyces sp. B6B3]|uniref:TerD family protein n=1 Tax=Streptomyces sp. B6B3 TaxID=3153570 RepID=UPI00325C7C59
MSGASKGLGKVDIKLKWDPSPMGAPDHDLDLVAAVFHTEEPLGEPAYLVHHDSRSPDGTITLSRDSTTGQGYGFDEAMVFELERLDPRYGRVVVGVTVQQRSGPKSLGEVPNTLVKIAEGYDELAEDNLAGVAGFPSATVAEFLRDEAGEWLFRPYIHGYEAHPSTFLTLMGRSGPLE